MARCKLTNMNLRNIRKTREYQCLLIDLVKTGVVGKSAAEGLLGYTIPEGLLGDTTPATLSDDDEKEDEEEPRLITIVARVPDGEGNWVYDTFEYDLDDGDTAEDILAAADSHWPDAFDGNRLNSIRELFETDEEGAITIGGKSYNASPAAVDSFVPGAMYEVLFVIGDIDSGKETEPGLIP